MYFDSINWNVKQKIQSDARNNKHLNIEKNHWPANNK